MLGYLIFGSWLFWVMIGIFSIAFIASVEYEQTGWATFESILLVAFVAYCLRSSHPLNWVQTHPLTTVTWVVGWFVAGTAWAVVKWWFYCKKIARGYARAREQWLKTRESVPQKGDIGHGDWVALVSKSCQLPFGDRLQPQIAENKNRFLGWMLWWPWSAFWTIINDPVRHIFEAIYESLAKWLQAVSDSMFNYEELK